MEEKTYSCEEILGGDNIYHRSKGLEEKANAYDSPFNGAVALIENKIGRRLYPEEKASVELISTVPEKGKKIYIKTIPDPLQVTYTDPKSCCDTNAANFISHIITDPETIAGPEELEDIKIVTRFNYKCVKCYNDDQIERTAPRVRDYGLKRYGNSPQIVRNIVRLYVSRQFIRLFKYLKHPIPIKPIPQQVVRSNTPADKITEPIERNRDYTAFWYCEEGDTRPCCNSSSSSIECEENPVPSTWNTDDIDQKIPCLQSVYNTVEGCNCIWHEACDTAYSACLSSSSSSSTESSSSSSSSDYGYLEIQDEIFDKEFLIENIDLLNLFNDL